MTDPVSPDRLPPAGLPIKILLAPLAVAFIVAACLAGGPKEVFKALTGRD